jgi:hypothetical protein
VTQAGPPSPLARFILRALGWLPVAFAAWYFAGPLLVWPPGLIARLIAFAGFGDLVREITQSGPVFTFVTTLRPGLGAGAAALTVDVDGLLYAFGLPLHAALVLAAAEPHRLRNLAIGYACLVPVVALGVVASFLQHVGATAGPAIAAQTGFSAAQREAITFAFQFGSLMLPAVVPVIAWVATHRRFLARIVGADAGARRDAPVA